MAALSACGGPVPEMPAQTWEGMRIQIETRPPQLEKGMNEFLVVASRGKDKNIPAHDLIVSLAINDSDHWEQAIQDGFVGVYRRAMLVSDPANDVLLVRIEHKNSEGVLRFPLNEQRVPSR
jgi:hypothetical protein